ncbi:MAG TPA: ATP-dependent 6-phosphofructokinase [Longimicrobiales bacterium]|nr:ATP-dependent 6-phosphofructokinase [Longimicrobiales bacterium]
MRIAINTGGGDAPGLNAVIRSVVLAAHNRGWEVFGIRKGYNGLFSGDPEGVIRLTPESVRGITHLGGTILGTTNRGNPFEVPRKRRDGSVEMVDRSADVLAAFRNWGFDCLIAVGGDGSLRLANALSKEGLNVIGVPKTIDNDLAATSVTFGFHTAVQTASDAIDRLHSTAESHRRVMVVELMGRDAGWIALFAGLSATADVILIPEIPYDIDKVCEKVQSRYDGEDGFAIVVAAEGAKPSGGEAVYKEAEPKAGMPRLGGIAERLERQIAERTGRETRSLVLGHLQRGGEPVAYDRVLALRFGAAAVELAAQEQFGCMVALDPPDIRAVPLEEAVSHIKHVPVDGDVINTARALGVSFGD